ncbi:hypothetical protein ACA30_06215 [Virgibacillus soli]|uniref:ABC transporter substrate-binding protein n=2 Tax=Lederbergia galactosidilytica TaxID=217031 RepID=A0A178A8W1_9BACI|nr:hypothetical protein ACA30_06215 [Virgibacillus soli]OAK75860.1 hypothetical protein ABB05_00225 [Lederbergia galactosidilytica]
MFVSACGNDKAEQSSGQSNSEPIVTAAGTFPIVEEEVTLDVMIPSNSLVKDFDKNEFTKWYEEKTGVHINWEIVPAEGAKEKLNLMLTSGDLPDVIMDFTLTPSQLMIYGQKGVFLNLNDLIDNYGVETKKMFEEFPAVKDAVTTPDGDIYALPQVNDCYHCSMPQKMWVYQPWLDELGLEMPTTTEEFYTVLKAFKEEDPNGNGKADEIPFSGSKDETTGEIAGFLMNAFIYNDMHVKEGNITAPWDKDEWKEGLKYLNKLYKEGLIYSGSFTQDADQNKTLGDNPDVPILGASVGLNSGSFADLENGRGRDFEVVPPLKGPDGEQVTLYTPSPVTKPTEFIITKNAKHPDVAMRWADAMYSEEITMRSTLGPPDEGWKEAEEGEKGLDGEQAKFKEIQIDWSSQNINWSQTGPSLRSHDYRASFAYDKTENGDNQEVLLWNATEKYEPYISTTVESVPDLFFTQEQASELVNLESTIEDFVDEKTAQFITGKADIDKSWDNYISELENIGLGKYIDIYQQAYDAKYK